MTILTLAMEFTSDLNSSPEMVICVLGKQFHHTHCKKLHNFHGINPFTIIFCMLPKWKSAKLYSRSSILIPYCFGKLYGRIQPGSVREHQFNPYWEGIFSAFFLAHYILLLFLQSIIKNYRVSQKNCIIRNLDIFFTEVYLFP